MKACPLRILKHVKESEWVSSPFEYFAVPTPGGPGMMLEVEWQSTDSSTQTMHFRRRQLVTSTHRITEEGRRQTESCTLKVKKIKWSWAGAL